MTIEPHQEWGTEVDRPSDLTVAPDDAALAALVADGGRGALAVAGGDLFRTIGARPIGDRTVLRALPLDVMWVTVDDGEPIPAVAHVAVRSPHRRGGWWRGPVSLVMNVEFLGRWEVAVRGHPNDGRVERFDLAPDTAPRQRLAIARRLPNGSHLPHPAISRRSGRVHELSFDRPMAVLVDGRPAGPARHVVVRVEPDAAVLHS